MMRKRLADFYYGLVINRWWLVGLAVVGLLAAAVYSAQYFKLDASADALVLENDDDLLYYRKIRAKYGSDDVLIVTYAPNSGKLFSDETLQHLKSLRDDLDGMDRVANVLSMLDVPLLASPSTSLSELQSDPKTLTDEDVDRDLARREFKTSPLYRELVMNLDADTTAMLITLQPNEQARELLRQRDALRVKRDESGLTEQEATELERVEARYEAIKTELQAQNDADIENIRGVLEQYRGQATIHLGGVPMITADMIDFVRDDIRTFGIGVSAFIVVLLAISFQALRWVLIPSAICGLVAVMMVGFLGAMDWRVTIVSSNFVSLMLIITLSLIVHLVVRYRELQAMAPGASQRELIRGTVDSKLTPTVYTVLTTVVSFASLMVADIRPVIDFGLMMVCGVILAFLMTFLCFPAAISPLGPGSQPREMRDVTARINAGFAWLVERQKALLWLLFGAIVAVSAWGMSQLTVENRFIDYFKQDTEIFQGMRLIDRELGGTTPVDVIIDAPKLEEEEGDDLYEDEFDDEFAAEAGATAGYWYNPFQMEQVHAIHDYLDGLPETGKVLSLSTTMRLAAQINGGQELDGFAMAVMYQMLPPDLKGTLIDPFLSDDGNQIRFDIRVVDSDPNLRRDQFLKDLRSGLIEKFDLQPEQLRVSGMLVLYNNVMQSLYSSQFTTLFVVFGAIMFMFFLLFRSLKMAVIGVMPTLVAAASVLGLMGLMGIPLDIMTITIAAITIGIGVHDTIHYSDRFKIEVASGDGYRGAVQRSHASVGRAMFYTTVIVTLGFSILALSNFKPTIYFGLFTGAAMVFALISNLALLPLLLVKFKPFPPAAPDRQ